MICIQLLEGDHHHHHGVIYFKRGIVNWLVATFHAVFLFGSGWKKLQKNEILRNTLFCFLFFIIFLFLSCCLSCLSCLANGKHCSENHATYFCFCKFVNQNEKWKMGWKAQLSLKPYFDITVLLQNRTNWGLVLKLRFMNFKVPFFIHFHEKNCTKPGSLLIETVLSGDPL